ncbi:alpha,alpha-trehalose-phosphate synthase (UDP-forming), variant [Exophiala oligosperma]|nr:alpha,alpha-trehalose-phosphate synthase (UDP-forming), variant [Exophiala oligosperma]KIW42972.1 alpha,alpha-trehalose-phosphate synthase (UDP-forming), variant [Exophiala oligosperma]
MPEKALFNSKWLAKYREVNEIFADYIVPHVENGDLIWIHDYQLLLLPGILRERLEKRKVIRIGFFLHTPFPREDSFAILPLREEICNSILSCDLVGLHIKDYADRLISGCEAVLEEVHCSPHDLHYHGRKVMVEHFAIGIDPDSFRETVNTAGVQSQISLSERSFAGRKIILEVDRLDYIKGMPQRLAAFDKLLDDFPEWVGKVVLIQVAVPSRTDVLEYAKLRDAVERQVGRINGKHSRIDYTPIHYMYKSVPFEELCALYAMADVCFISSIQDGMNLVSYEYVACQQDRKGVLLLSQYTGAAKMLPGALITNPWDTPRCAEAINEALTLPAAERIKKYDECAKVVNKYTSIRWGRSFLNALESTPLQNRTPRSDGVH